MKKILSAIVGAALLSTAGLVSAQSTPAAPAPEPQSQQPPADAQPSPQSAPTQPLTQTQPAPSASATPAAAPNSVGEKRKIAPGSVIPVQLTKTVDAKKAKMGDEVIAKVTQDMKTSSGELLIPKDTKMIGHVTEVQARSKEQKNSQLAIAFERAVMKDGEMPLPMSIQAIVNEQPTNPAAAQDDPSTKPSSTPVSGGIGARTAPVPTTSTGSGPASDSAPPPPRPQITGQTQGVVGIPDMNLASGSDPAKGSVVSSNKNNVKLDSSLLLLLRVN